VPIAEGSPSAVSKTRRSGGLPKDAEPPRRVLQVARGKLGQFPSRRQRKAQSSFCSPDGTLEFLPVEPREDPVGEARRQGARRQRPAEAERFGEGTVAFVGQPIRQRRRFGDTIAEHPFDEGPVGQIVLQAEGAQRHAAQTVVFYKLRRGHHIADRLAEIVPVARLKRAFGHALHLRVQVAETNRQPA
jgi:hypothetical protein